MPGRRRAPFVGDLSAESALRRAIKSTARNEQLVLLLLNAAMSALGYNFVNQLRSFGVEQHLLLTPSEDDCGRLSRVWRSLGDRPSACGWPGTLVAHKGWRQYGLNSTKDVLALYTYRWHLASRLTDLGVSVLVMDVDAALLADVSNLLLRRPLSEFDIVLTDQGGKSGINCGFVYFNMHPTSPQHAPRECSAKGRSVRPAATARGGDPVGPCISAARWFARVLWQRFLLFLELPPGSEPLRGNGRPSALVLWEQDLWNDVLRSIEEDAAMHPWNYGKASATKEARSRWRQPPLSYERRTYEDKLLRTRRRTGRVMRRRNSSRSTAAHCFRSVRHATSTSRNLRAGVLARASYSSPHHG
jgi:hypothetical protein